MDNEKKIKKQSDGKYYEKIYSWKKNKDGSPGFVLGLLGIGMGAGIICSRNVKIDPLVLMGMCFGLGIILMLLHYLFIHDIEIKFKRIN